MEDFGIYVYEVDGYYFYSDIVEGDKLVEDIQDASFFSEKHTKQIDLESYLPGSNIWCDKTEDYITANCVTKLKVN